MTDTQILPDDIHGWTTGTASQQARPHDGGHFLWRPNSHDGIISWRYDFVTGMASWRVRFPYRCALMTTSRKSVPPRKLACWIFAHISLQYPVELFCKRIMQIYASPSCMWRMLFLSKILRTTFSGCYSSINWRDSLTRLPVAYHA
jgi:hypothetical protein